MLNPAILFPVIWIFVIVLSPISGLNFDEYSNIFYLYIAVTVIVFSIFSILGGELANAFPLKKIILLRRRIAFKSNINTYIIIMSASIFLQIFDHALMLGSDWWSPVNIVLYRYMVFEENETIKFAWVSWFNFFFFTAIPMLKLVSTKIWQKILIYILIFGFVYLSSARAPILVIMLILHFFDWIKNGFRLRLTLVSISVFLSFYMVIAIMTEKIGDQFGVLAYALAPSHAFDQILNGVGNEKSVELYTFPLLHNFLYLIGVISEIPSRNLGFYFTPVPTNVYTIFGPYVLDFGIMASVVFLAGIGLICGFIYKLSKRNDNYLIFLCSMMTALLCLSVFHDYFTSAGFVWASAVLGFVFFPQKGPQTIPVGNVVLSGKATIT